MITILYYAKSTERKYRWDANIDGTPFEIYIPIDVFQGCRPESIRVQFSKSSDEITECDIRAVVSYKEEMSRTVRYDPIGDSAQLIGSPYIPISMLHESMVDERYPEVLYFGISWRCE